MWTETSVVLPASVGQRGQTSPSFSFINTRMLQLPVKPHRPSKDCIVYLKNTFQHNESLKSSRCRKRNTSYPLTPILYFFFSINSIEVGSSRTRMSLWGMEKWPRHMPGPLLVVPPRCRRRKLWHGRWGKRDCLHRDTFISSNWCLVWNSQKEA